MPIFEFACADGHEFQLWSEEPRMCPVCGSEFLKRIFITPPNINEPRTKFVDNLIKNELDKRGITNVQSDGKQGETNKVTYKSTPADLAAEKVKREFPQMNDPKGVEEMKKAVHAHWAGVGVKGVIKSGVGNYPEANFIKHGVLPALKPNDQSMVQRKQIRDPQNLQLKKG